MISYCSGTDFPDNGNHWNVDTLWWVITGRCNLKCKHCYIEAPSKKHGELTYDKALQVVEQAREAGIRYVFLTGGEPFIRTDILKIVEKICEEGLTIKGIETNGTLLSSATIDTLGDESIVYHVSYDGIGYNEYLRGVEGIDETVIENIRLLRESGIEVVINSILNSENKQNILRTYDLLRELGIDGWRIFTPACIGYWKFDDRNIDYDAEACTYIEILKRWLNDNRPFEIALGSLLTQRRENGGDIVKPGYVCDYFRSTVTLLPDGKLVPCCRYIASEEMMKETEDVFRRSMKDQIHSSKLKAIKSTRIEDLLSADSNKDCRSCKLKDTCDLGCRVNAYLETGDFLNHELRHCYLMRKYYRRHFRDHDSKPNSMRECHE